MVTACWSLKGGAGTTVVAAGLALALHRRGGRPVLLVDLAGDQPALLGLSEPAGPGVAEWLAAGPSVPPDALARLEETVLPGLALLHRGLGPLSPSGGSLLGQVLASSGRDVVVDCGTLGPSVADPGAVGVAGGAVGSESVPAQVAAEASRSLLVTRSCYLAVRRLARSPLCPSGVVVVRDPGRVLDDADIARHAGAPLVASVAVDPAVARAVDSGLLVSRVPRGFAEVMRAVA